MPLTLHSRGRKTAAVAAPEDRREQLLMQIGEWIGRVGVVNFSLRAAAKAVGVSAPTLLRHFGSKEGLLTELVAVHTKGDVHLIRASVAEAGSLLAALQRASTKSVVVAPEYVRLHLQLAALQNSEAMHLGYKAKAIASIKVLAELMVKDGVPSRDATAMAYYMQASSSGFLASYAVFQDLAQLQQNYRTLYTNVAAWMKQSAAGPKRAASF